MEDLDAAERLPDRASVSVTALMRLPLRGDLLAGARVDDLMFEGVTTRWFVKMTFGSVWPSISDIIVGRRGMPYSSGK